MLRWLLTRSPVALIINLIASLCILFGIWLTWQCCAIERVCIPLEVNLNDSKYRILRVDTLKKDSMVIKKIYYRRK